MRLTISFLLLLLVAIVSVEAATALNSKSKWKCGTRTYTMKQVQGALRQAKKMKATNPKSYQYPHAFNNHEKLKFARSGLFEFPILPGGKLYNNAHSKAASKKMSKTAMKKKPNPGADRVVYDKVGRLQGLMYHPPGGGNTFKKCTEIPLKNPGVPKGKRAQHVESMEEKDFETTQVKLAREYI